ncbi:MAG: MBOAT family O-acyltransferase [Eubacteriales bacterium]
MLFSSITFLYFFLPVTLGLYYLVPRSFKNHVLLLASLVFYAFGEPRYVLLLLLSALVGWLHGLLFRKYPHNRGILASGLCWNLAFLLFFKYADFLIGSLNGLLGTSIPLLGLTLPVGISFYTFQNMSYLIDVYRGDSVAEPNPASYATYLCLFPQLIAGPIVRYSDVARELQKRSITLDGISRGALRFTVGLGKKVLLANTLGQLAELAVAEESVLFVWLRAVAYTLQIYFDFAGYSDMAIGLGAMMGFKFPENFDYPYLSRSVTEFWRRWHMTLGQWFRDYVYIPLGGSRTVRWKWLRNVLAVWMLTGIWHGANWNFLLWGLYYGILLLIEKLWLGRYLKGRVLPHIYVLLITVFGFVLFHSNTASQAAGEVVQMLGLGGLPAVNSTGLYYLRSYGVLLILGILGSTPLPKKLAMRLRDTKLAVVLQPLFVLTVLVLVTACLVDGSFNPFLYFRF